MLLSLSAVVEVICWLRTATSEGRVGLGIFVGVRSLFAGCMNICEAEAVRLEVPTVGALWRSILFPPKVCKLLLRLLRLAVVVDGGIGAPKFTDDSDFGMVACMGGRKGAPKFTDDLDFGSEL